MFVRIFSTAVLAATWWGVNVLLSVPATLVTGQIAGRQFNDSDTDYAVARFGFAAFNGVNVIVTLIFLLTLAAIWWHPIKSWLAKIANALVLLLLVASSPRAYYDKTNYTEAYFILPNESAFFIPDVGANRDNQSSFGSEAYLLQNKIAAKRFEIPHAKLAGSAFWADYFVPTGRLIIVDRSPFNREWVAQSSRGTSAKDESFPCQSKEGLNISVGIAVGASVFEENAAKFLYRFGVKPPQGDRTKPEVIFTSVFYGRSLAEVMDGPVRSKVQSLVCNEFTKRTFDEGNSQALAIMQAIEAATNDYLKGVGISLDYVGWADTFTFDHSVQDAVNRRYVASQDVKIAETMAPHVQTLQGLSNAEATRTIAGKWDGKAPSTVSLWWLPSGLDNFLSRVLNPSK
jgi:hypothetical protein